MKKSILFMTHLYYPSPGGAERVFQRLAEGLARRNYSVTVLTSDALSTEQYFTRTINNLPNHDLVNGVLIIRERLSAKIYKFFKFIDYPLRKAGRLGIFCRPLFFGPHFCQKFKEVLKKKVDIIVAGPTPTSALFYGLLYKMKNRESRFIIFPHMHIEDRLHTSPLNLWAIKKADAVLVLTDAEKKYLLARGVKEEKLKRIVNGVDELLLQMPRAEDQELKNYILYLGQEGGHKRIPMLIEAMKNLWDAGCENKLVIAGARTNFSPFLDNYISSLLPCHKSKIVRCNNISEEQKVRLLDNCLVMVNPSAYEAFGIVFLEAWARGKPVIGAKLKALQEIIRDGSNGFLFDGNQEADLEAKLLKILNNPELGRRMGQAGNREVREKYVWDKIVEEIENLLFL